MESSDDITVIDPTLRVDSSDFTDPYIGEVFDDRYHIVERVGVGGMGRVYRARQLNVGRDVAVKILTASASADPAMVQRFTNEARIISQLRHPNTLKLIDFGQTAEGLIYTVTEFLKGDPLDRVLSDGPIDPNLTIRVMRQVCESLEEAHSAGIIHRDLKSGNVYLEVVGPQDIVKVLDFGIAKLAEQPDVTPAGDVFGSPAYMSPEQARGDPVDARTDLYSLGIVAYECLSGRVPFMASKPIAIMLKHIHEAPPPLEGLAPGRFVAELSAIVMRLLSKDPDLRPPSTAALRDELERLEQRWANDGTAAPPLELAPIHASTAPIVPAPRRRTSSLVVGAVAAAVAAIAVSIAWWVSARREVPPPAPEPAVARTAATTTPPASELAPAPPAPVVPVVAATAPAADAADATEASAATPEAPKPGPRVARVTPNAEASGPRDAKSAGRATTRRLPRGPKKAHEPAKEKSEPEKPAAKPTGWLPVDL